MLFQLPGTSRGCVWPTICDLCVSKICVVVSSYRYTQLFSWQQYNPLVLRIQDTMFSLFKQTQTTKLCYLNGGIMINQWILWSITLKQTHILGVQKYQEYVYIYIYIYTYIYNHIYIYAISSNCLFRDVLWT